MGNPNPPNQFEKGNKVAQKSPKVVMRKFQEIYQNAIIDKEVLSWQQACLSIGWRVTKCDYWAEKISVFGTLKKEIMKIVASRVNSGAIKGDFNPAASIWRMKQCGEVDTTNKNIDVTTKGDKLPAAENFFTSNDFSEEY